MLLGHRLFIIIRNLIFPYWSLGKYIGNRKNILDVGCGHGTLCYYLANGHKQRSVLGIDPSSTKIKMAKRIYHHPNLRFQKKYLSEIKNKNWDVILAVDILYLLPKHKKLIFINEVKKRLRKDGIFLLKETEASPLLRIEEFFMTKIAKLTFSQYDLPEFMTENDIVEILQKSGFRKIVKRRIKSFFPYHHKLYVVKK